MRLLERKDNGEFSLTKVLTNNIPAYSILSHTWGDDDQEVSLKDLTEGSGKSKAGYQKIRFCGAQAARDGVRYIWVDTCCIDKESSTELSEALNSMYRWYRNAIKCYVYLTDVSISDQNPTNWSSRSGDKAFQRSRWFTRGWTLQELIAPQSVEFFSIEGELLGDKKSLERQIHDITGIPISALQGTPPSEFSVTKRFSWAAKRETKKEEDKAYSLLGIFGVFLPLIYGEGQKNAFRRLREEVERSVKSYELDKQDEDEDDNKGLQGGQRIIVCYRCGEDGHFANDPHCYKCGGYGHFANDPHCRKCGEYGHVANDLHCYKCGEYGHFANDPHCYKCGEYGHLANACQV